MCVRIRRLRVPADLGHLAFPGQLPEARDTEAAHACGEAGGVVPVPDPNLVAARVHGRPHQRLHFQGGGGHFCTPPRVRRLSGTSGADVDAARQCAKNGSCPLPDLCVAPNGRPSGTAAGRASGLGMRRRRQSGWAKAPAGEAAPSRSCARHLSRRCAEDRDPQVGDVPFSSWPYDCPVGCELNPCRSIILVPNTE